MVDPFGEPVFGQLPWLSASEAEGQLTARDRRALQALRVTTADAVHPGALESASLALARLVRAPIGVVAAGDPVPSERIVGSSLSSIATDGALWSRVNARRLYDPRKLDCFANRPVNTSTLARRFPARADGLKEIWKHLSVKYQLRSVLAVDGVFSGYVGVWREPRDGVFCLAEHARMAAALPKITDLLVARRAIGAGNGAALAIALDAFDQCAFLMLGQTLAYANCAARRKYASFPEWLRFGASRDTRSLEALANTKHLDVDGRTYLLVIPRSPPADPAPLATLPASLRRVAELMADGWSDKEIAALTGYTLATARTFASRVLERLGLNGRGELVRLVHGR